MGNAVILGVLCNVLVTVGVLLSLSAKDLAGRVAGAWLPVAFFVICGFAMGHKPDDHEDQVMG